MKSWTQLNEIIGTLDEDIEALYEHKQCVVVGITVVNEVIEGA